MPEDPRVRFAAERTLLAWMRTGLALMGFGFVVARFGIFLRELPLLHAQATPATSGVWSVRFGVILVAVGVLVTGLAGWEYRRIIQRIDRNEDFQPMSWSLGLLVATLIIGIGIGMIVYLVGL